MIINQSVEYIPQIDILQHIELCARNAYKSEDKIKDDSCNKFLKRIISSRHHSVLEHGAIYLIIDGGQITHKTETEFNSILDFFQKNHYSRVEAHKQDGLLSNTYYITSNMRVLIECELLNPLFNAVMDKKAKYKFITISGPTKFHIKRYTFRCITDQKIAQEIVRHRNGSYCIESTRWINYLRKALSFISIENYLNHKINNLWYILASNVSSFCYKMMIKCGERPEIARSALLNGTKADVIISMFEDDWEAFFGLRSAKDAHPLIHYLSDEIKNILYENSKNK